MAALRRNPDACPELARPSLTPGVARRNVLRTAPFATIPVLPIAAVLYNTSLARCLRFLLPVVHFLPGRVGMPSTANPDFRR